MHPLLEKQASITYAATTSTGHDNTIAFKFDAESDDLEPFKALPSAEYVLIVFPLKGKGQSRKLLEMYKQSRPQASNNTGDAVEDERKTQTKWMQLGSTGIYTAPGWSDSSSPIDTSNDRGIAEDELISLGGCVLNLAGLYGAQRQPKNWISRVAKTKEQLAEKGALHLVHGVDVARAVLGVIENDRGMEARCFRLFFNRRWIIADCVSYDWWSLVWDFSGETEEPELIKEPGNQTNSQDRMQYRRWIVELMQEQGVKALPRPSEALGRKLDAREFWIATGMMPERTLER